MKKIFTKLLIISIIVMFLNNYLCSEILKSSYDGETKLEHVEQEIDEEIEKHGEVGDVAGYGFIFKGIGALIYDAGSIFTYIILIGIPVLILRIVVVIQVICRLFQIGIEKKWKNFISQIFTGISIGLQMLVCVMFLIILFSSLDVSKLIVTITLLLNVTSVAIYIIELAKASRYKINNQQI